MFQQACIVNMVPKWKKHTRAADSNVASKEELQQLLEVLRIKA